MDHKQLRYILTIAKYGSFTEAANILYVTQPSLSHMVSQIEGQLGVQLFDRSTSPVTLTYAGEIYTRYAEDVLAATARMESELRDIAETKKGRLRIGIPYERAAYMLPRIIPPFREKYPLVQVEVTDARGAVLLGLLDKGHIDVALMPVFGSYPDRFDCHRIYTEPLVLTAAADLIRPEYLSSPDTIPMDALREMPFILQPEKSAIRTALDQLFEAQRFHPRITQVVSGNTAAYGLSKAGLGVSIVPEVTILLNGIDNGIRLLRLGCDIPAQWDICAVFRHGFRPGTIENSLIDIAKSYCSALNR